MKMPLFRKKDIKQPEVINDDNLVETIHIPARKQENEEERTKGIETIREVTEEQEVVETEDEVEADEVADTEEEDDDTPPLYMTSL